MIYGKITKNQRRCLTEKVAFRNDYFYYMEKGSQWLAYGSFTFKTDNEYMQYHYQKKFLEERILPFMSQFSYTVAEGHYTGRPLGMKRSAENQKEISPKILKDLVDFAGLGTFIVTHKKNKKI